MNPSKVTTVRRSMSLFEKRYYNIRSIRDFHITRHLQSKSPPKRSPKVRAAESKRNAANVKNSPTSGSDSEDYLPPMNLIVAANKSGVLDVEPSEVMSFLPAYRQKAEVSTKAGWEQDFCTAYGVSSKDVAVLSGILRRGVSLGQQILAQKLALAASAMGEKSATFDLIQSALKKGKLHEWPELHQRLGIMAKKDGDHEAMALLGRVLHVQQKDDEALEWIQKATRPPTGHLEFGGSGEALVLEGQILLKRGDKQGAEAAFKKAALELDEPRAYYHLAEFEESGSPTQEVYLLKAASSGILQACHNLGAIYIERIQKQEKKPTSLADYGMAREWFQVAAADGFGPSILNMALMCRAVGQEENGLAWLAQAVKHPGISGVANKVREQWSSGEAIKLI